MADILSGLEKLGLGGMKNIEVYEKKPIEQNNKNNSNGAFDTKNDDIKISIDNSLYYKLQYF